MTLGSLCFNFERLFKSIPKWSCSKHPGQINYHVIPSSRHKNGVPTHKAFAIKRYLSDMGKQPTPDLTTNSKQWQQAARADANCWLTKAFWVCVPTPLSLSLRVEVWVDGTEDAGIYPIHRLALPGPQTGLLEASPVDLDSTSLRPEAHRVCL